jgi:hypothetical protein
MKIVRSLLLFVFTLVLVASPCFSVAQESDSSSGLTISPPIKEINLEPGKTYQEKIKVNNPTKNLVEVFPVARNFSASENETGIPTIETPSEEATYGLASWISFSQSKLALTSEQEAEFNYTINVPLDAEPGGHYGAVLFASEPPKIDAGETRVSLASMVGSLILAKVAGDAKEGARIKEFSTSKRVYFSTPVDFTLRIENTGNIHFKPQGDIVVKNWGKISETVDINSKKGNVLPKSVRNFSETDKKGETSLAFKGSKFSFGKFTADLVVVYGSNDQSLTGKVSFWIIPWWLIVTFSVITIVLITLLILRKKKNKKIKPEKPFTQEPPKKKKIILQ